MTEGRRGSAVDWTAARGRLARALAATEEALSPPPERAAEILQERARALATAAAQVEPARDLIEVIAFELAGERYALETKYVREVRRLGSFTPVPGAPDLVGIVQLSGELLPLLDLRRLLGLAPTELPNLSWIVIVGREDPEFGLPVDEVMAVEKVRSDEIAAGPETNAATGRRYFRGLAKRTLQILDGAELSNGPVSSVDRVESQGMDDDW